MKAIISTYVGPRGLKGSKIVARDSDGNKAQVGYDDGLSSDDNHQNAVQKLCRTKKWTGVLIAGEFKPGTLVWIWDKVGSQRIKIGATCCVCGRTFYQDVPDQRRCYLC